jgi:hypothetical protein
VKPRKTRARKAPKTGKETVGNESSGRTVGTKRKQQLVYVPKIPSVLAIEYGSSSPAMAGLEGCEREASEVPIDTGASGETHSDDSNKKQRNSVDTSTLRSADPAEAELQPRQTQWVFYVGTVEGSGRTRQ